MLITGNQGYPTGPDALRDKTTPWGQLAVFLQFLRILLSYFITDNSTLMQLLFLKSILKMVQTYSQSKKFYHFIASYCFWLKMNIKWLEKNRSWWQFIPLCSKCSLTLSHSPCKVASSVYLVLDRNNIFLIRRKTEYSDIWKLWNIPTKTE